MTEDSMHRTLNAALARNSGPSAEDGLGERVAALADRWEARADDFLDPIPDVMRSHAAALRALLDVAVDGWADGWDVRPLIDRRLADARAEGARAVVEAVEAAMALPADTPFRAKKVMAAAAREAAARVEGGA